MTLEDQAEETLEDQSHDTNADADSASILMASATATVEGDDDRPEEQRAAELKDKEEIMLLSEYWKTPDVDG